MHVHCDKGRSNDNIYRHGTHAVRLGELAPTHPIILKTVILAGIETVLEK